MADNSRVKICWLGKKHQRKYVCFIPLTIDGMGKTVHKALENLEEEALKIVQAIQTARPKIKCNMTEVMIRRAIRRDSWWKQSRCKNGKAY